MNTKDKLSIQADYPIDPAAVALCKEFVSKALPTFIFGINEYADSIASLVDVDGFIDEYTNEKQYLNKPIFRLSDIPKDSMVVSVVIGRPFVAEQRLADHGCKFIDYFSFHKHSDLPTLPVKFWDDFRNDISTNLSKYQAIYNRLHDDISKSTFTKIVNFRLSYDLEYMRGFNDNQANQYFEDFLRLSPAGETFVDVGGYDGYTSLEFIKRCPNYEAIHVFEPEPNNLVTTKNTLSKYPRVSIYPYGLSNRNTELRFSAHGSSSKTDDNGELEISVKRLDDILNSRFSYIKMDIEGGELPAIEGAKELIASYHPRLAICVYHRFDDFWQIPELILSIRDDYTLFLRHYTEGVDETVMYFIPSNTEK